MSCEDLLKVLTLTYKKGHYEVVLSNGDTIICGEDLVVSYRLVKDKEISYEAYDLIKEDSLYYEALSKARGYAISFIKTSKQITDYLIKKGYSKEISKKCVDRLIEERIIDDSALKEAYVSRLVREGNGRLMISHKLREKGFDTSFDINEEEYYEALDRLIKSKLKMLKDNKKIRLERYLSQRGYTVDEILKGLRGVNLE